MELRGVLLDVIKGQILRVFYTPKLMTVILQHQLRRWITLAETEDTPTNGISNRGNATTISSGCYRSRGVPVLELIHNRF